MLRDLFTDGDFLANIDNDPPILDTAERSHMSDVGGLVRVLAAVELSAIVVLLVSAWLLRRERERRARLVLRAALGVGGVALMLGIFFAVAFDTAFASFHALFFQEGTWQFGPESNLIRLFPEPFWFETSLLAGLSIVLGAGLAAWVARRGRGSGPAEA
jgi:integral membrane protein (TIGR01906 family)